MRLYLLSGIILCAIGGLRAASVAPTPLPSAVRLSPTDAITLGVVEGLTEFLPISSTGHLIIASHLLQLDSEAPLHDNAGRPLWYKKPGGDHPEGVPLTLKLAADTYSVVIQVGAILAVLLLYYRSLFSMVRGLLGLDRQGSRLLRNLLLAFFPVAIVGLAAIGIIEKYLFSIGTVIIGLIGGSILMLWVERWRWRRSSSAGMNHQAAELYPSQALKIGAFQCLALLPGTSRSMVTIVGGYLAGLNPARAAEFSFLLGLPVLAGATVVKGWRSGEAMITVFGWTNVLLGIAVAAISAAIAVRFLVAFLSRHGLVAFAVYRLVLAAVLATVFYL